MFEENNYQLFIVALISLLVGSLVYLNRKNYFEIKFFSEYYPLTKTFNRRAGYNKIQELTFKNDKRNSLFSLCFIDVNGLKQVNDNLGHEHGDDLLVTVSDIIRYNIRDNDFIIRQGGDEFIIVFNDINADKAEKIWKRINSEFQEINKTSDKQYLLSVSHGIVEYTSENKRDIPTLIQLADDRMYQEKEVMKVDFDVLKRSNDNK